MRYHTATDPLIVADEADNTLFAVQVYGDRRRHTAERGCLMIPRQHGSDAGGCCRNAIKTDGTACRVGVCPAL